MGFQSMIQSNVRKAFSRLKDLAVTVTLSQMNNTTYNFGTNAAASTSVTTKSIKGVLLEKKRVRGAPISTSLNMEMLFMAADLDDPDIYDTITMPTGDIWKVVPPYKNDGFLITVGVAKEA